MSSTQPVCRIIPCLDLANGRVVKGVNFVDLNDAGDPIEVATRYAQAGADEIVLLNITGDATNNAVIHRILAQLSQQTKIPITVGGGMRSLDDLQAMITAGASKVSINSAAVDHPELIKQAAQQFGSERLIIAIDAKLQQQATADEPHWEVCTRGGKHRTGLDAIQWAQQVESLGAGELLLTSMDQDGTQSGFDLALTRAISDAVNIPVIASGGVGTLQHLADGVLKGGAQGVLAASIFHYGTHTIEAAKEFLNAQGIHTK
ncbi:MAG TPA: imidazole glycerol phosphate synthase subunit HisF [Paenalcaligenes sp.]|nr:imidazole glycerol phosphate synthase subunit HisF [Paenalcaligenes sp.]